MYYNELNRSWIDSLTMNGFTNVILAINRQSPGTLGVRLHDYPSIA